MDIANQGLSELWEEREEMVSGKTGSIQKRSTMKDRLFADTPEGAEATAIHFSIMETAKANGLNVETYVQHLLSELPERFAKSNTPDPDDLLAWSETMR